MNRCNLCPRKCNADRSRSQGFCGAPEKLKIARAGLHFFEEPFFSGNRGSGAVFFSCCNLKCVYCQNSRITRGECFGIEITEGRLADIFKELEDKGAHNINLVTGTPYIPQIAAALEQADIQIPVMWNSSGYESVESLEMLEGLVDIWLPDFKTMSPGLGERYMGAPDYPEVATAALEWMAAHSEEKFVPIGNGRANAEAVYDDDTLSETGIMTGGVCVRHLVIPGQADDSINVLKHLSRYKDRIWISVMSQYTPMRTDFTFPELNGKLTEEEYDRVVDAAAGLGLERCMIQMGDAAGESFIPAFDGEGV